MGPTKRDEFPPRVFLCRTAFLHRLVSVAVWISFPNSAASPKALFTQFRALHSYAVWLRVGHGSEVHLLTIPRLRIL